MRKVVDSDVADNLIKMIATEAGVDSSAVTRETKIVDLGGSCTLEMLGIELTSEYSIELDAFDDKLVTVQDVINATVQLVNERASLYS